MHLHLCSQCRAIITVDEGRNCPSTSDHEEMLAETSSTRHIAFSLDSGDQIDDALSQSIIDLWFSEENVVSVAVLP